MPVDENGALQLYANSSSWYFVSEYYRCGPGEYAGYSKHIG